MNMKTLEVPAAVVPCVVCGRRNKTKWRFSVVNNSSAGDVAHLTIAKCPRCGHVYQSPQADKNYTDDYYDYVYETAGDHHAYWNPTTKRQHAVILLEAVRAHHPRVQSVLDVGAGMGAFVAVAREAGLDAHGTEMAPMAVKKAKELFGVSLHLGDIDSLPGDEQYDAVVLWDVIEHCPRPDLVLKTVSQRVKPNGKVILTTGNYESHDRMWSGRDWWCWHQDHYHYFSPSGMAALAARYDLADFVLGSVPRIRPPAGADGSDPSGAPSRRSALRFLNPSHVRSALRWKAVKLYSRLRHPAHSEIGIMLCVFTKKTAAATGTAIAPGERFA